MVRRSRRLAGLPPVSIEEEYTSKEHTECSLVSTNESLTKKEIYGFFLLSLVSMIFYFYRF